MNSGITFASVPDDYDNEIRPIPVATKPDIGADERDGCPVIIDTNSIAIIDGDTAFVAGNAYTAAGTYFDTLTASNGCDSVVVTILDVLCAPLAGVYTIGGVSPDFPTIDSSVQAMILCGIDSAVLFNIRDGNYTEQVTIPSIVGNNAANTITYQSESLDSSLVNINWPTSAAAANNYVIEINGVDYITFRHLTIERTGSALFGGVVLSQPGSNFLTFQNNHLLTRTYTGSGTAGNESSCKVGQ